MTEAVRKDDDFSGTKPVEERHRIDEVRLDGFLKANVEGYQGPLTVLQFKGGQSNPTYRLNTPGRAYVMRRKPFGKLLPSAHAVDREFKVIAALGGQGGGGRPDMAQGGGPEGAKALDAVQAVRAAVAMSAEAA